MKFGDVVENIAASERNPIKRGYFVRYCNSGDAEYTDGKGKFIKTPVDNLKEIKP